MKQILFIISVFSGLSLDAQTFKADISITSVTLTAHYGANQPYKLVPPQKNTTETNIPPGGTQFPNISQFDSTNNTTTNKPPVNKKITGIPDPLPPYLSCSITVQNGPEDAAHETTLIAVLPGGVNGQSSQSGGVPHKAPGSPYIGYFRFNLGQMAANQTITVSFIINTSLSYPNKVSVYVFSGTSDPNPANNYKEASF